MSKFSRSKEQVVVPSPEDLPAPGVEPDLPHCRRIPTTREVPKFIGSIPMVPVSPTDASGLVSGSPPPIVHLIFRALFLRLFLCQVKVVHESLKSGFSIPCSSICCLVVF